MSLALAAGATLVARRGAQAGLEDGRRVLALLVEEARASTAEAEQRLSSGRWDLVAEVPSGLVARVLQEFVGYRQRTKRGNVFVVRSLTTTFEDGYAVLRVRADFDWRWGLYDGPVEATYYAFARMRDDGGCDLFFRIAEMRTLAPWRLLNRFLEPILTYRLQRLLEIPNLRLPLGLALPAAEGAGWSKRFPGGLEVEVPARPLDMGSRRVLPLLDARRLGVVVERPASSPPIAAPAGAGPGAPAGDRVRVAARLDFLSERLAQVVAPETDFTVALDRWNRVWAKRTKGGTDVSVDVVALRGAIDIRDLEAVLDGGSLALDTAVRAVFSGQIEGSILRIRHAVPLRVESSLRRRIPLEVVGEGGGLGLRIAPGELSIPLDIEARLSLLPLRFTTELEVPGEILARAVRLPALVLTELKFPTRVERGQVVESKRVPIAITWEVAVPAASTGAIEAGGDLRLR